MTKEKTEKGTDRAPEGPANRDKSISINESRKINLTGQKIADIRPLKKAAMNFPEPVKTLILSEPDTMDASEFIGKIGTWEKLLRIRGD